MRKLIGTALIVFGVIFFGCMIAFDIFAAYKWLQPNLTHNLLLGDFVLDYIKFAPIILVIGIIEVFMLIGIMVGLGSLYEKFTGIEMWK